MKRGIFLVAGITMLMLAGCGGGGGGSSTTSEKTPSEQAPVVNADKQTAPVAGVSNGNVSDTTITNEFGLNPALGTPPPLPAS